MNERASSVLQKYESKYGFIKEISTDIHEATDMIITAISGNGKLLVCGNGGSNSDADHIVGELLKGFNKKRPLSDGEKKQLSCYGELGNRLGNYTQGAIPAINLGSHMSLITAVTNDLGGEYIFSQQVMGFGQAGDVLLGISTSGNSQNVINAVLLAKSKGLKVIGLTGNGGGKLSDLCDCCLCVPACETPDIQDMHTSVYHAICAALEAQYWQE